MSVRHSPVRSRRAHFEPLECRRLMSHTTGGGNPLDLTFGGGDGVASHRDAGIDLWIVAAAAAPDGKVVALGKDYNPDDNYDFFLERFNADGTRDTSFAGDGYQSTDLGGADDEPVDVIVQADGKVIVAGTSQVLTATGYNYRVALARYNADGSPDTTFDGDGIATFPLADVYAEVTAIAAAPGNKIVVLGYSTQPSGPDSTFLLRTNPDGSPDATFDGDGVATLTPVGQYAALDVAPDGKVVVAGIRGFDQNPVGASGNSVVTRLTAAGAPDPTFSADGTAEFHDPDPTLTDYPRDVVFFGQNISISYSTEGNVGGAAAFDAGVLRLNDDGVPDPTFGDAGRRRIVTPGADGAIALAPASDGKLYLGVTGPYGEPSHVVRLTPGGALDTTYGGGDGVGDLSFMNGGQSTPMYDTVLQPSGRAVGLFSRAVSPETRFGLAALTPEGLPDASFRFGTEPIDPVGRFGSFYDLLRLPDGKLLAAGDTSGGNGPSYLARFNPDGSPDTSFGTGGKVTFDAGGAFTRLALQPDGKFLAYGHVLVRFLPGGQVDTSFGGGDGVVAVPEFGDGLALQPDGKILVTEGRRVARYNPDGSPDASFGNGGRVIFDSPIGRQIHEGTQGQPYSGFIPTDVAWQASSGNIVLGGTALGTYQNDFAAVRLHPDGSLDTTFAAGAGLVSADSNGGAADDRGGRIDLAPDGTIYMAGTITEDFFPAVLRFDKDGRSALERDPPRDYGGGDIAVGPDGEILAFGTITHYDPDFDEHTDFAGVRLNPDLSIDPTFGGYAGPRNDGFGGAHGVRTDVFGRSEDRAYAVVVTPDGDVIAAGTANNSPVLVAYEGGGARRVQFAYVAGSAWADPFRQALGGPGYRVTPDTTQYPAGRPLPWVNLNQVALRFNRPVTVGRDDLRVRGVNVAEYGIAGFSYDADTHTAVWTLDRTIGADRVSVELDADGVGAFAETFDVLPGDVDRNGSVVAADASAVKRSFFRSVTSPIPYRDDYSVFLDVNGSGSILADDFSEVKRRFFTQLPAGEPTAAPAAITAQAAAPLRSRSVARSLFGATPVLD